MDRKKIQEARMKGYFLQATREILRSEGLKNISVRNIADKAGYSYATLYNYFKDVKDLVFECVKDFQQEAREFIDDQVKDADAGIDRIKAVHLAYFKYFVQYPGIFELFYMEKTTDLAHQQPTIAMIHNFVDTLTEKDWQMAVAQNKIEKEGAELLQEQIKFFIVGLLTSYINRRMDTEYTTIMAIAEKHLSYILDL
jgi:AcrR family transcriptional regulator